MTVENGLLSRTWEENAGAARRKSASLPVDSSFSPVTYIEMDIEETRVGQKTNYDRLVSWRFAGPTGTLSPNMALVEGAKILRKQC